MLSNIKKTILLSFSLFGAYNLILLFFGYRLSNEKNLIPDWVAIGTVVQIMVAIATFLAVYVAIEPAKLKLAVNFSMINSDFSDLSIKNSKPKIMITNTCNRTVVLHKISIMHGSKEHISTNLVADDVTRPLISKVNNINFDKPYPIVINPGQTAIIELFIVSLNYVFEHMCDVPSGKEELDWIYICVTETFGKNLRFKTNIRYKQYYENIIRITESSYGHSESVKA